jgi:myo-inositol-1(or 4)-monophosphatase
MTVSPSSARPVAAGLVSSALEVAGRLANDATDVITATAGRGGSPAEDESPFGWVTDTDRILERHTRRVLTAEFPGIPVLGAEIGAGRGAGAAPVDSEYRWVVDPVDGTANYLAGMPWCAYSLALVDVDGPVVGVVADPYRAQIYAAARGRGARANGNPVRLAARDGVAGAIVCTELTGGGPWPGMVEFIAAAAGAHVGVRILGSAALAVVQVALGHAAATVLPAVREWDVAAALAVAGEAGCVIRGADGLAAALPTDGLIVAAPGVTDEVFGWWHG